MKVIQRQPDVGYLDNMLWVPKSAVNVDGVKAALTFAFSDNYDEKKTRNVVLWRETDNHLLVPRSFWKTEDFSFPIFDIRPTEFQHVQITSKIKLDHRLKEVNGQQILLPTGEDVQRKSFKALQDASSGTLQLACGKGKTCVALHFAAWRSMPTLIVLPDTQLLEQWRVEIDKLLDVPGGVGLIQANKFDWQKAIVLTTYHTIGARCASGLPEEVRRWFGTVIWDEGHHIPAPTFCPSAEAFYGFRLSLTATPERSDGWHVISEFHVGPIIFRDLSQTLKPRNIFLWTGLELPQDADVYDRNGEIHFLMQSAYNATWPERRNMVLDDVAAAVAEGRKVLVLSGSEQEILNLAELWETGNWETYSGQLFSDIAYPTPAEMNLTTPAVRLSEIEVQQLQSNLYVVEGSIAAGTGNIQNLQLIARSIADKLEQHNAFNKFEAEYNRRKKNYIKALVPRLKRCGIMIHKVAPALRKKFIDEQQVVFAITKYGKEGLDAPDLDTVLVSSLFSDKNILQQLMGRPTREKDGKKKPVIIFYEDNVKPIIAMCTKLRKHLRGWSHEDGGPYDYERFDTPNSRRGTWKQQRQTVFSL